MIMVFIAGAFFGATFSFLFCALLSSGANSCLDDEVALWRERCEANDELIRQAELVFRVTGQAETVA